MKKAKIVLFFVLGLSLAACKNGEKSASVPNSGEQSAATESENLDKDTSYAFGMVFATELKDLGLKFDYDNFLLGFKDSLEGKENRLSEEEAGYKIQTVYTAALTERTERLKHKEIEFLAANTKKKGVTTTASGLQYEIITEGKGAKPLASDTVQVNYEGTLIDGTVFDSSYTRGEPVKFPLNRVIPGWTEGIQLMTAGSTYLFYIPSNLGYGENGSGSTIPPYSTLIFKVDLLDIAEN
jgi:FKBP-type peptidyl-prolyl cis-trans isomerase FkpA